MNIRYDFRRAHTSIHAQLSLVRRFFPALLFCALAVLAAPASAQTAGWVNFTSNDEIYDMAISGDHLWLATRGGLVRLNRTNNQVTFFNRANSGIPHNMVYTVAIDRDGKLWAGTLKGVVRFDGTSWTRFDEPQQIFRTVELTDMLFDRNNNLWISNNYRGLVKYDGSSWTQFTPANSGLPDDGVNGMALDSNGNIWVATNQGPAKFDGTSWISHADAFPSHPFDGPAVSSIGVDTEGHVWLGTYSNGVVEYDGTSWTVHNRASGFGNHYVTAISADASGNTWVGVENSVMKFDGSTWTSHNAFTAARFGNRVSEIIFDANGAAWIGGSNTGLVRLQGQTATRVPTTATGLMASGVLSLATDRSGAVWTGTTNGLAKYGSAGWSILQDGQRNPIDIYVTALAIDSSNNLWLGTFSNGVGYMTANSFENYHSGNSGFPGTDIVDIEIDRNGDAWIGTSHGGVAHFDGSEWMVYDENNSTLTGPAAHDIAIDAAGNKWFGTDAGLAKFDGTEWTRLDNTNSGLPHNFITGLAARGNVLWVGTQGGLAKYEDGNWTVYDTSNSGLPANNPANMTFDRTGRIWMTAGKAVARFDGTSWLVFDSTNSVLPDNSVTDITVDGGGNVWFATGYGIGVYTAQASGITSEETAVTGDRMLGASSPNPTSGSATIRYSVSSAGSVRLTVLDLTGREIARLVDDIREAGEHHVTFDASGIESGIYLYRIECGERVETHTLTVVR